MRKTIWGFALLVIMAFLASCSESSEYTNAIPKDAAMVVSLDFKSMAQKSGINGKEGESVVTKWTGRRSLCYSREDSEESCRNRAFTNR